MNPSSIQIPVRVSAGQIQPEGTRRLEMFVVEVGIDRTTQKASYRLLYYSTAGGDKIPWNQIYY